MPELRIVPINHTKRDLVATLMEQEDSAWMTDLDWDYSPVRDVLLSFLEQDLLSGFIAHRARQPLCYSYFIAHNRKGVIGTLYASRPDCPQEVVDGVLAHVIEALRGREATRRIEAQIMPFHGLSLNAAFIRHGFQHYTRYFLELPLRDADPAKRVESGRVVPWDSAFLRLAADVALNSYRTETDALICDDYCSAPGCEAYLRSLVENPGCGIFLPEASFMALDERGLPCGFIICSRISHGAAMIPQISMLPAYQGQGLGNGLMHEALATLKELGYRSVSLTVTKKNRRAFEWYVRLGFRLRKEFGAYVWQKSS